MTVLTLDEFLTAPLAEVAAVAPSTIMIAITGTRRAAALAGKPIQGKEYVRWSRERMIELLDLLFRHGVQHIIATAIVPANLVEHAAMREHYIAAAVEGMTGSEARYDYARLQCRARLIAPPSLRSLAVVDDDLRQATALSSARAVWWHVTINSEDPWQMVLEAAQRIPIPTRADLIRAIYGEDIPPATMFLGFGKPIITQVSAPPLLVGEMQCYWSQRPGFSIDERMLRRIFYDYACLRRTWTENDRSGRYTELTAQREDWETEAVLGVGQRLGSFWYPEPFPAARVTR
jgi:hypothetical protein